MRIETHLMLCVDMLREANSPYPPSRRLHRAWLERRDRLVRSADALAVTSPTGSEET